MPATATASPAIAADEAAEAFPARRIVAVTRWQDDRPSHVDDHVAEEVPIAMVYNGISHAVMLATSTGLEQFGLGFSLTEGIINDRSELYDLELVTLENGIELQMTIAQQCFAALKEKRRSMAGRTGCGLCGAENLQHVVRHPAPVGKGCSITSQALHTAFRQLAERQPLQMLTGAVHAAAWVMQNGDVVHVQEDVGRHNALDKLIGTLAESRIETAHGFVIVTSRASYEMVQKAASFGISMLAAISAPTGLAIDLARETGLTLIGFTRNDSHVVYAHPHRIA
ncbi:protein FdhD [mine drainage metagenome]|uniref:Protein FdhD n=1 Tax=mine drainage metagenome TaxID=410659 RepID=A0A1J5R1B5_9ZZZZ